VNIVIFKNIEFHNVEQIIDSGKGFDLVRVPENVVNSLKEKGNIAYFGTGVELRFIMKSDEVKIILRAEETEEAQVAYLVFGSLQGGWEYSSKIIYTHDSVINIKKPYDMDMLRRIHKENKLPFDCEVVRVLLPYCRVKFIDVIGDICPPQRSQLPKKRYLAYGSSITHGSLSLNPIASYVYQTAENLGADPINLGFAGSARLEEEMAKYIVSRKDWDFATIELGVNLMGELSCEEFKERAKIFIDVLSKDTRPILCTDIFTLSQDMDKGSKAEEFRKIVRSLAEGKLPYKCGREIMTTTAGLSADFTHPNLRGVNEIAKNMTEFIKANI
jgi:hypothetical protein